MFLIDNEEKQNYILLKVERCIAYTYVMIPPSHTDFIDAISFNDAGFGGDICGWKRIPYNDHVIIAFSEFMDKELKWVCGDIVKCTAHTFSYLGNTSKYIYLDKI